MDKQTVLKKIENGFLLKGFPDFQNDEDVAYSSVAINLKNLKFVSEDLRNNKKFIASLLTFYSPTQLVENKEWLNDEEFAHLIVDKEGVKLNDLSETLRKNKDIVFKAAIYKISSFYYAHDDLKNDKDFIKSLVYKNTYIFSYASDDLRNNKDFFLECVNINNKVCCGMGDTLRDDEEIAKICLNINARYIVFLSPRLRSNKNLALLALKNQKNDKGTIVRYFEGKVLKSKEVFLEVVKIFPDELIYADLKIQNDREILELFKSNYKKGDYKNDDWANERIRVLHSYYLNDSLQEELKPKVVNKKILKY
jgi:hypothetical protein